jgi:hypothetical protein
MDGRIRNGGKRPGAGTKSKAVREGLKDTLDVTFPQDARENVLRRLVDQALDENPRVSLPAATLLLAMAYGRPTEHRETTGSDGEPLEIRVLYADA